MKYDQLELEREIREMDLEALHQYQTGVAEAPVIYKVQGHLQAVIKDEDGSAPTEFLFVASDEAPDRIRDVIRADGWDLTQFKRNPSILWSHDYSIAPIGKAPQVWVDGKQLLNTVAFDHEDEFAAFIEGKVSRGMVRAESVGFRPLEFSFDKENGGVIFTKQELLEISIVSVGMHPKALRKMLGERRFAIVVPEQIKELALTTLVTAPAPPVTTESPSATAEAAINKDKLTRASALISEVLAVPSEDKLEEPQAITAPEPTEDELAISQLQDEFASWKLDLQPTIKES